MSEQRATPMYLLHGKRDNVVDSGMSDRAYRRFLAFGFPRVKYHAPSRGHPYDFLPIDKAIHWLDMMTTTDPHALKEFGDHLVKKKTWRDVGMVIERAKEIKGGAEFSGIWKSFETAAEKSGHRLLKRIEENKDGKWIDKFLDWQEQFSFSTKCKETAVAFAALQSEHEDPAKELYQAARKAFQSNNRAGGYAKYQEIVDKYYASTYYRTIKATLDKRK